MSGLVLPFPAVPPSRHEFFPRVVAVCRRLLRDEALAHDTAEDVWVDFSAVYATQLRTPAAAVAYLQLAAVRRCRRVSELRARQAPLELISERPSDQHDAETQLISSQELEHQRARLRHCMDQLEPHARRLLRMRFHLEMTQEAIGTALGVSKQYAGRVLARTLELVRACAAPKVELEVARG